LTRKRSGVRVSSCLPFLPRPASCCGLFPTATMGQVLAAV